LRALKRGGRLDTAGATVLAKLAAAPEPEVVTAAKEAQQ